MTASSPFEALRTTGEKLPGSVRSAILALGDDAIAPLVEVLQDDALAEDGGPGDGWPPIHAVDLLIDLKNPIAIGPMLDVLEESDIETVIHNRIAVRLREFGAAALEPLLARLEEDIDPETSSAIVCVLAELGVRDERVFEAICDDFDDHVELGASNLAEYGDPRGLPWIVEAILHFEVRPERFDPLGGLVDLVAAYEQLSGSPMPEPLREHVEAIHERFEPKQKPARASKVGRNEPCPCGSGKKYKKCCIDKPQTMDG